MVWVLVPRLRELGARAVAEATGVSERRARDWLRERAMPHPGHRESLVRILRNAPGI